MATQHNAKIAVIGAGPGGYTAAFRAADLIGGDQVVLIDSDSVLGGVCLNRGCIPSKALLHAAQIVNEAEHMKEQGVSFGKPKINLDQLRDHTNGVVKQLNQGLAQLAKKRKVTVLQGYARFADPNTLQVEGGTPCSVRFEQAIVAAGSRPVHLPFLPDDPRVVDSTGVLQLPPKHKRMLVLGGGIIGLEMATVYHALGAEVDVVEMMPALMGGVDDDLTKTFQKIVSKRYRNIFLETKVVKAEAKKDAIWVHFEGKNAPEKPLPYDLVLSAVGRVPNGKLLDAEKAGVHVDERGFMPVDDHFRTNVPHIHAIGDLIGNPMLAHKAIIEGHTVAELAAGVGHAPAHTHIPSVAYTDPEVAWTGLTEKEAKAQNIPYGKGVYPWAASGRALGMNQSTGLTKLLFDPETHTLLGGAVIGAGAGDIVNQITLALEMRCVAEDLILTVPAHPTLSESVNQAAAIFLGVATDLYMPKKD